MGKHEILCTRYAEMLDMIACFAIYNGATPKTEPERFTFSESLEVI